jgi:hypothetical protein
MLWIRDSESGAFLTSEFGIRDRKNVRIRIRDEQLGSYFRELRKNFLVEILQFFDADPGSRMGKIRIRDGKNSNPGQTSRIRKLVDL